MSHSDSSANIDRAREYYVRLDAGRSDLLDLFADDFEFYFPKYGIGVGKAAFVECATGLGNAVSSLAHDQAGLRFFVSGDDVVVVEGTTSGTDQAGIPWKGGETPGGRFCSLFEFGTDGLVTRMHIYLDPDYTGQDEGRFHWGHGRRW